MSKEEAFTEFIQGISDEVDDLFSGLEDKKTIKSMIENKAKEEKLIIPGYSSQGNVSKHYMEGINDGKIFFARELMDLING